MPKIHVRNIHAKKKGEDTPTHPAPIKGVCPVCKMGQLVPRHSRSNRSVSVCNRCGRTFTGTSLSA
jgi:ribosomal protein L37AE/L43A